MLTTRLLMQIFLCLAKFFLINLSSILFPISFGTLYPMVRKRDCTQHLKVFDSNLLTSVECYVKNVPQSRDTTNWFLTSYLVSN